MIATLFRMYKLHRYTKWKLGDNLLEIKERTEDQSNPVDETSDTKFTCFRNFEGFCVYVRSDQVNDLLRMNSLYSKELNIMNLTEITKYLVGRNAKGEVYDKINPPTVKVKFIGTIKINDIEIYTVYTVDLEQSFDLYNDLINYSRLEGKYN